MEKQWFVHVESGECVQAFTVWDAIHLFRRWYTGELSPETVLPEDEFDRREKLARGEVV